jgi:hypothetical protein
MTHPALTDAMRLRTSRMSTVLPAITAVWFAGGLIRLTAGLRLASTDDLNVAAGLRDPATALAIRMVDLQFGRIYTEPKFAFLDWLMRVPSDGLQATVRVAALVAAACAAAWFVWEWRRSAPLACLTLMAVIGACPVTVSYQALLSLPLLWAGWAAVWAMGALSLRLDTPLNRCLLALTFGAALAVHEGNAVFLVWAITVRTVVAGRGGARRVFAPFVPCLMILVAYGALSLLLRGAALDGGLPPGGGRLALTADNSAFALGAYTFSGWPGLECWLARWTWPGQPMWVTPHEWIAQAVGWTAPAALFGALAAGICVWLGLSGREECDRLPRQSLPLFGTLVFAAFAPNLLLAMTPKYQIWAHQRMWPYYYTSMSFSAWVVLLVLGADAILARMLRPACRRAVRLAIATLATMAIIGTAATSRQAVTLLRQRPFDDFSDYRRWLVERGLVPPGPSAPKDAVAPDGAPKKSLPSEAKF